MRAGVAAQAVEAGAELVNDVSGGLADAAMLTTVSDLGVPIVLMHWRAPSDEMDNFTHYDDVVAEVVLALAARRDAAVAAGIVNPTASVIPAATATHRVRRDMASPESDRATLRDRADELPRVRPHGRA